MVLQRLPEDVQKMMRSSGTMANISDCILELVLNSIDAQSNVIRIGIDLKSFKVEIMDNGNGIGKKELAKLCTRYMTTKCHSLSDLNKVLPSYGFKGESLASIREISKEIKIMSKLKNTSHCYEKVFYRENSLPVTATSKNISESGTNIIVDDIFYHYPVRRQVAETNYEQENICSMLESVSLINPQVSFIFRDSATGETKFRKKSCGGLLSSFTSSFKIVGTESMIPVYSKISTFEMSGFISFKSFRMTRCQFIYVNRRLINKTEIYFTFNSLVAFNMKYFCQKYKNLPKGINGNIVYILNIQCPYLAYDTKSNEFCDRENLMLCFNKAIHNVIALELNILDFSITNGGKKCVGKSSEKQCSSDTTKMVDKAFYEHNHRSKVLYGNTAVRMIVSNDTEFNQRGEIYTENSLECPKIKNGGTKNNSLQESCHLKYFNPNILQNQDKIDVNSLLRSKKIEQQLKPSEKFFTQYYNKPSLVIKQTIYRKYIERKDFCENELQRVNFGQQFHCNSDSAEVNLKQLSCFEVTLRKKVESEIESNKPKNNVSPLQTSQTMLNKEETIISSSGKESDQIGPMNLRGYTTEEKAKREIRDFLDTHIKLMNSTRKPLCFLPSKDSNEIETNTWTKSKYVENWKRKYGNVLLKEANLLTLFPYDYTQFNHTKSDFSSEDSTSFFQIQRSLKDIKTSIVGLQHSDLIFQNPVIIHNKCTQKHLSTKEVGESAFYTKSPDHDFQIPPRIEKLWWNNKNVFIDGNTGMSFYGLPEVGNTYTSHNRASLFPKGTSPIANGTINIKQLMPERKISIEENNVLKRKKLTYMHFRNSNLEANNTNDIKRKLPLVESSVWPKSLHLQMDKNEIKHLLVIGQVDQKYIACIRSEDDKKNSLILFDQHAVDERIRLEKLFIEYCWGNGNLFGVDLTNPLRIAVEPQTVRVIKALKERFEKVGIKIGEVMLNCIMIKAVPMCLYNYANKESESMAATLQEGVLKIMKEWLTKPTSMKGFFHRIPETIYNIISHEACSGALKFGKKLSKFDCEDLLKKLAVCQIPFQCAHGRPNLAPITHIRQYDNLEDNSPNFRSLLKLVQQKAN